ncbi:hypothetical protein SAMN05428963_11537 [Consotaella salsifontis]|uniref:DUF2946 domain-containing protein n=1 Tax=Consotaella salsifontis TaxID=1365950 RepID=A0A1T4SXQ5_9HYPH|nr:hypothetical protein SAMN05428963_11537 [Consotaella salsifontis]
MESLRHILRTRSTRLAVVALIAQLLLFQGLVAGIGAPMAAGVLHRADAVICHVSAPDAGANRTERPSPSRQGTQDCPCCDFCIPHVVSSGIVPPAEAWEGGWLPSRASHRPSMRGHPAQHPHRLGLAPDPRAPPSLSL